MSIYKVCTSDCTVFEHANIDVNIIAIGCNITISWLTKCDINIISYNAKILDINNVSKSNIICTCGDGYTATEYVSIMSSDANNVTINGYDSVNIAAGNCSKFNIENINDIMIQSTRNSIVHLQNVYLRANEACVFSTLRRSTVTIENSIIEKTLMEMCDFSIVEIYNSIICLHQDKFLFYNSEYCRALFKSSVILRAIGGDASSYSYDCSNCNMEYDTYTPFICPYNYDPCAYCIIFYGWRIPRKARSS